MSMATSAACHLVPRLVNPSNTLRNPASATASVSPSNAAMPAWMDRRWSCVTVACRPAVASRQGRAGPARDRPARGRCGRSRSARPRRPFGLSVVDLDLLTPRAGGLRKVPGAERDQGVEIERALVRLVLVHLRPGTARRAALRPRTSSPRSAATLMGVLSTMIHSTGERSRCATRLDQGKGPVPLERLHGADRRHPRESRTMLPLSPTRWARASPSWAAATARAGSSCQLFTAVLLRARRRIRVTPSSRARRSPTAMTPRPSRTRPMAQRAEPRVTSASASTTRRSWRSAASRTPSISSMARRLSS